MKNLYLVGAGGMGREVLHFIIEMQTAHGPRWNIMGFLDDTENPLQNKACDYGVVGTIKEYVPQENDALLMCIASPQAKQTLVPMLKEKGAFFDSFISPWAYLGRHNTIGEGAVVYGGFGMTVNCTVGDFATLLTCSLGHDVQVGNYCTLSSNTRLLGNVSVGNRVFFGESALIAPHIHIGDDAYVGLGSVVVRNVKAGEKVFGNPAREIGI